MKSLGVMPDPFRGILLDVQEAAAYLGVSVARIYALIREGKIPARKEVVEVMRYRIPLRALEDRLEAKKNDPPRTPKRRGGSSF